MIKDDGVTSSYTSHKNVQTREINTLKNKSPRARGECSDSHRTSPKGNDMRPRYRAVFSLLINIIILVVGCLNATTGFAKNVTVNLNVGYKTVNFAGKSVQAIATNNQIPAPTLHFKQGDTVTINVYNH